MEQPYQKLKLKDHYDIRLIQLLPGTWDAPIECRLKHYNLASKPRYSAISYAWGSATVIQRVIVDQVQMNVTANLESALRHIRRPDSAQLIWTDALCINQRNNEERSRQVMIMRDIYSLANEVIVFLGDGHGHRNTYSTRLSPPNPVNFVNSHDDHQHIESFIQRWSKGTSKTKVNALDVFCLIRILAGSDREHQLLDVSERSEYCDMIFEALRMLLLSQWWTRIWVFQEIIVSKKVLVQYGGMRGPWEMFVAAALEQPHKSQLLNIPSDSRKVWLHFSKVILEIEDRRRVWHSDIVTTTEFDSKVPELWSLLRTTKTRKASDDRDKIFALLGLLRQKTSMIPNYNLSTRETYTEVMIDMIRQTKSLDILCGNTMRKNRSDIPSWAVDWSATADDQETYEIDLRVCQQYNACGDFKLVSVCSASVDTTEFPDWVESRRHLITREHRFLTSDTTPPSGYWSKFISDVVRYLGVSSQPVTRQHDRIYTLTQPRMALLAMYPPKVNWTHVSEGIQNDPVLELEQMDISAETVLSELFQYLSGWNKGATSHFDFDRLPWADYGPGFTLPTWDITESTKPLVSIHGTGFLLTLGVPMTKVSQVSEPLFSTEPRDLLRILNWLDGRVPKEQARRELAAFRSFVFDLKYKDGIFRRLSDSDIPLVESWCRDFLLHPPGEDMIGDIVDQSSDDLGLGKVMETFASRRRMFITTEGGIGWASVHTQVGDTIFALPGARTPFMLRRVSEQDHTMHNSAHYQFVGDCFLQGAMEGKDLMEWGDDLSAESLFFWEECRLHQSLRPHQEYCFEMVEENFIALKNGYISWLQRQQDSPEIPKVPEEDVARLGSLRRELERLVSQLPNTVEYQSMYYLTLV
ncbi:heterokaryon incompatibility protein-domain-containing protein [Xylariales sp. PMI_506]|nr:heterokaryon incompatibility protein-domain-containing protein [Xylariales sp. PMI_506]